MLFVCFRHVLECWRINGEDEALLSTLLDQLLDILAKTLPYEERQSNFDKKIITRIATLQPIAVSNLVILNIELSHHTI